MNPKLRAWLQLFRAPNLFTVPGDPLAGFIIITAGWLNWAVLPAVIAALCFYAAGLAMNDFADLAEDRVERPKRPLASGAIDLAQAKAAVVALSCVGLALLWFFTSTKTACVGAGLMVSITLYNFLTKKIPVLGALNMGACRALSLILGAFAAGAEHIASNPSFGGRIAALCAAATAVGLYITAVTHLARHETHATVPKWVRFLPLGALLIGYVLIKQFARPVFLDSGPALWLMALFMGMAVTAQLLRQPPLPLPPRIGGLIRLLLIIQAALVVLPSPESGFPKTPHSLIAAFLLLAAFPLSTLVGKRFYGS